MPNEFFQKLQRELASRGLRIEADRTLTHIESGQKLRAAWAESSMVHAPEPLTTETAEVTVMAAFLDQVDQALARIKQPSCERKDSLIPSPPVIYEFEVELRGKHGTLSGTLRTQVAPSSPDFELQDAERGTRRLAVKLVDLLGGMPSDGIDLKVIRKIVPLR